MAIDQALDPSCQQTGAESDPSPTDHQRNPLLVSDSLPEVILALQHPQLEYGPRCVSHVEAFRRLKVGAWPSGSQGPQAGWSKSGSLHREH